jgi:hypothetical protein
MQHRTCCNHYNHTPPTATGPSSSTSAAARGPRGLSRQGAGVYPLANAEPAVASPAAAVPTLIQQSTTASSSLRVSRRWPYLPGRWNPSSAAQCCTLGGFTSLVWAAALRP